MYIWRHSNIWTPIPIKGGTLACSFSHLSLAMLLILFVYYIIQWASIDAGPIPSVNNRSPAPNHCTDLSHCRSIWNIIWSCLVTIFSCTWVAVHPNIPCPKERKTNGWIDRCILNPIMSFAKCRLPLFVCALLVPEYVLAWAIRQFLSARKISKGNESEYKTLVIFLPIAVIPTNPLIDQGWSMTHGFFVIMGGFHLFERKSGATNNVDRSISPEDGEPLHPLGASNLLDYCESFIMLTEVEIMDKGKSDWLAKSLVLLQTSWFVAQCIARAMRHLPVTHLEIVTLAYAAMNFVIFLFWWKKPRNVHRPIRVFRRSSPEGTPQDIEENQDTDETHPQATGQTPESNQDTDETHPQATGQTSESTWMAVGKGWLTIVRFIVGFQDKGVDLSHKDRVPMFWANSADKNELLFANFTALWVGVCSGAIHCIAWYFSFPTHTELLMWRISSIALTTLPICIPLMFGLAGSLGGLLELNKSAYIVFCTAPVIGILYIFARVITLVLAFVSLMDLPPGAYETVRWTTFIPHI